MTDQPPGSPPPPPGGSFPPPPPPPPPGGGYPPPGGGGPIPPPPGYGSVPGVPGPLAEWQERLVSGLVDYVGPWILFGIISTIIAYSGDDDSVVFAFNPLSFGITLLPLAWALYNGYLAGQTGQSIGMKMSNLRLVSEQTGQPIGGSQGLVRNLLFVAAWVLNCLCFFGGLLVLVDSLFPLWDAKKQTLRDKIAKSVVIKTA